MACTFCVLPDIGSATLPIDYHGWDAGTLVRTCAAHALDIIARVNDLNESLCDNCGDTGELLCESCRECANCNDVATYCENCSPNNETISCNRCGDEAANDYSFCGYGCFGSAAQEWMDENHECDSTCGEFLCDNAADFRYCDSCMANRDDEIEVLCQDCGASAAIRLCDSCWSVRLEDVRSAIEAVAAEPFSFGDDEASHRGGVIRFEFEDGDVREG